MKGIWQELRRRDVFRVAGLYVGIAWISIEAASVLLPAFDAPEWVLRSLIILALLGFPFAVGLSWIYEVTEKGILREEEAREEHARHLIKPRQFDFIVIGILAVALSYSLYVNLRGAGEPEAVPDPITLLIADFENATNDPVFEGSLEQALNIGLESAPFIASFARPTALRIAQTINPQITELGESAARLVSLREGVKIIVAGSVQPDDQGYSLDVRLLDSASGEVLAEAEAEASSKVEVLEAVGRLAAQIRKELGDESVKGDPLASETFTAASLEAAHQYTLAQEMAASGQDKEAVDHYRQAIDEDPSFGRAYSGLATSLLKLGRNEEGDEQWKKALSLLDGMTPRERYRTLGVYYMIGSGSYANAIENYRTLVDLYPADGAAHNNLAVAYFYTLDFQNAMVEGGKALEIYPKRLLYRANYALYSMYAGEFERAAEEAQTVIDEQPSYFKAYLPQAIAALARADVPAAEQAYARMSEAGERGASLAQTGLADAAMVEGRYTDAKTILNRGIEQDEASGNTRALATKYIMLAETYYALGDEPAVLEALNQALALARNEALLIPAANIYLQMGELDTARELTAELNRRLQSQSRAYANLIEAQIALAEGRTADAVDALRRGIDNHDYWLLRYYLGIAFVEAGAYAEALAEFEMNLQRSGEAAAVFLDDVPSYRYVIPVKYWLGRAQEGLGIKESAAENYRAYLELRKNATGDPLVADAGQRLASL